MSMAMSTGDEGRTNGCISNNIHLKLELWAAVKVGNIASIYYKITLYK